MALRQLSRIMTGWFVFWSLLWLCWALGAPVVADAARQPTVYHHICPMLQIKHGVGSDLRTTTKVRDLCG